MSVFDLQYVLLVADYSKKIFTKKSMRLYLPLLIALLVSVEFSAEIKMTGLSDC